MSNAGRRFVIIGMTDPMHFYGMQVGEEFIACENPEGFRGIWIQPAAYPNITEEHFKDMDVVCMVAMEEELTKDNKYIQEIIDGVMYEVLRYE